MDSMIFLKKILDGSVCHLETRCIWVGKIKISHQLFLLWTADFLHQNHKLFANTLPTVTCCHVAYEIGGQWWGPRIIALHVKDWRGELILGNADGYLEDFYNFCLKKISLELGGAPVFLPLASLLDALEKQMISDASHSSKVFLELQFEVDLNKFQILNPNNAIESFSTKF